jgi:hypothetical protein
MVFVYFTRTRGKFAAETAEDAETCPDFKRVSALLALSAA